MQYYRCECGESEFYGSDSPRPCMGCDKCGTTYAQSPTGHRPREPHQWRPQFSRETGAPTRPICTVCMARGDLPEETPNVE